MHGVRVGCAPFRCGVFRPNTQSVGRAQELAAVHKGWEDGAMRGASVRVCLWVQMQGSQKLNTPSNIFVYHLEFATGPPRTYMAYVSECSFDVGVEIEVDVPHPNSWLRRSKLPTSPPIVRYAPLSPFYRAPRSIMMRARARIRGRRDDANPKGGSQIPSTCSSETPIC